MWTIVYLEQEKFIRGNTGTDRFSVIVVTRHQAATAQTWLNKELAEYNAMKYSSRRGSYVVAPVPMVMS